MTRRVLLILGVVFVASGAHPSPPEGAPRATDPTAKERVKVAEEATRLISQAMKDGKAEARALDLLLRWRERLFESQLATAETKADRVKVLERRLEELRGAEKAVTSLFEKGEYTRLDVLESRYAVLIAEARLASARAEPE